ncbi:MAG: protein kinase domain-containing protein [Blastocatellia bacterium]
MMSPERWQQIEDLYHSASDAPRADRAAFLDQACQGDDELRREVVSLLEAHDRAESFIEAPPNDLAAAVLAIEQRHDLVGHRLGHYRILSLLGAGGMGEVYLAEDTILGRKVALKLLPEDFTRDRERVQRFKQEARAASALNHPNIITIFEIGQSDDLYFIVTEYIDGRTLRQRMSDGPIPLHESLDVVIQTANALTAAHEAGIVHRDIKPENIMLRRDGYVKVLDFGLAKLLEPSRADAVTITGAERSSDGQFGTDPGKAIGTPRYMSPEQIRAQPVDARTDNFSLGVVLYEVITGHAPFRGATTSEVVAAILHLEPMPLARFTAEVPEELDRIVRKALRKEREERYQLAREFQLDLKTFKGEMEFKARLATANRSEAPDEAPMKVRPGQTANEDTMPEGVSGSKSRPGAAGGDRRARILAMAALFVILAGLLVFLSFQWIRDSARDPSFRMGRITRLTTEGKADRVAISPDGKEVLYSVVDAGQQSLRLRQVETGGEITILPPEKVVYYGLAFSRDGAFIYYVRGEVNDTVNVLYQSTKFGGATRRLCVNVDSAITFSPDGRRIAFVRRNPGTGENALMIANGDCGGERMLAARRQPDVYRLRGPSWSPDGKLIATAIENLTGASFHTVAGVGVADGVEKMLTSQKWEIVSQVAWLADGSGLLVIATEPQGHQTQLWSLAWPGGAMSRITRDLGTYSNLSLTADSSTLATVRSDRFVNIWVAAEGDASRSVQITTGAQRDDGIRGLDWTPDGQIVYRSFAGGNPNVWIMDANGGRSRQLTPTVHQNTDPIVSPDGSFIAWSADRLGVRNIWRMNPDGSNERQLTHGGGEWFPQFTPDGKWMVYQALAPGQQDRLLWKAPLDGGAPVQLTDRPSYAPVLSPDGKLIVCNFRTELNAPIRTAVLSIDGGAPLKTLDLPATNKPDRPIRWTPDGSALAYIVTLNGVSNIWTQLWTGGIPKQLTHFKSQEIMNFAWSRDGRMLALSRGAINSDVVLITSQK